MLNRRHIPESGTVLSDTKPVRKKNAWRNRKLNTVMRKKLAGLFVFVVLALICLLIRMTYINATRGEGYTRQVLARSQSQYSSVAMAYKRGDILDRNGTVLATSEKKYNVILDCYVVNSSKDYAEPTINALTSILGIDGDDVRSRLTGDTTKNSRYQIIKRSISVEEKQAFDKYRNGTESDPLTESEKRERYYIRGVWFEENYVRTYPLGSLAGEVLGFVYDTDKADWGIEGYYNNTLCGVDGRKYGYWGSDSQIEQTIAEPVDGETVKSTIDINIQKAVEDTILKFEDFYKEGPYSQTEAAKNIAVVVMNPNNGAICAMATSEGYDPNKPRDLSGYYSESRIEAMSSQQKAECLQEIWKNFCISDAYEPGSVFKPVTVAAALETGAVSTDDKFVCDGYETVSGIRIKCSNTEGHGEESLLEVVQNSCNDGLMQIGGRLGVDSFSRFQEMFNFGSRTGIDLSGEAAGIVGAADTMGSVDLATASFGQGFTCTMIQEIAAISSIVNGGSYYRPHVVSSVIDTNGNVRKSYDSVLMKQTVSPDVSEFLKSAMRASVENGTSRYAKVDGYSMGGKTGTAQKIPRGNGKYLVSFIGFVPYDNPQVVIYCIVDEPNVEEQADNRYPQWIARDILKQILPYMNVYPDEPSNPENTYLALDFDNPTGEEEADTAADTNVPEPQGTGAGDQAEGGNTQEEDGYTNEEAGMENN